ncbi:hypothetical protein BGZ75_008392 [Mortierella antarctica]|nr:hypothetical protein BGZ75_008392 [Mortierella antarctica]
MVRIAIFSSLAVALMSAQAVFAEVVPTGTYRIVKGAQHVSDVRGRSGQPVALTPPYTAIRDAQKWDIINSNNDTVIIQNKKSKLYLSVSEPFDISRAGGNTIKVESQPHHWNLEYSANQDAYFIQYAGVVGIGGEGGPCSAVASREICIRGHSGLEAAPSLSSENEVSPVRYQRW